MGQCIQAPVPEDPDSMPRANMTAHDGFNTPGPSSGLRGAQACEQCTDMHVGKYSYT